MAITIKHAKTDTISDWTQTDLDAQIALGNFPPGTTLADIVLPSDWNDDHTISGLGTMATQNANNVNITGGSISGATVSGYIPTTEKGAALGVATLDAGGQVPLSQLPPLGDLNYQGTWNASTNSPTLTSSVGTKGYYYVVNVAGTTNLNGITDWQVGDWAVYNGSAWQKIDNTDAVTSVNGYTGTVVLTYSDVGAANAPTNTNITSMTGVTGGISSPDFIQLDTTAAASIALGKLRWNADTATAAFGIIDGTTEVNIGEQMYAYVTNAESVTITAGQAVYLYQATGNRASVKLAYNTGDATSAKTLGLVTQDIAAGATGFVTTQGTLAKLDTSAFAEGTTLYLGATAGSLTSTKPKAPNHLVYIGVVERSNAGNGLIYVRPQNGYELDEIHDVQINSPSNGQTILYDASTSLWKNANLTAGTGISISNGAASVTITNSSPDQTVAISGTSPVSVTGTYPNFTVSMTQANTSTNGWLSSTDWNTFNGKQTAYTNLSTFGALADSAGWLYNNGTGTLSYSTPTAAQVGAVPTTRSLTINGTSYDLSADRTWSVGTVTSVAALTLGTSGTDLSSTVATGTTTPVITLNVPTASATNRGALSSADWTTFNSKAPATSGTSILYGNGSGGFSNVTVGTGLSFTGGTLSSTASGGTVTSVSVTSANGLAGTVATSTTTPAITLSTTVTGVLKGNGTAISAATAGTDYSAGTSSLATGILKSTTTTGDLSIAVAADFPTLNQNTTGTAAGLSSTLAVTSGGTGTATAFTTGSVVFAGASGTYTQDNANFFWDDTNNYLGVGTSSPTATIHVKNENNAGWRYEQYNNGDGTNFRNFRARGTIASPTAVQSGDRLGSFLAGGYGATAGFSGVNGGMSIYAAETFSGSSCGTYLVFGTTATGANTGGGGTERMRIDSSGNVLIGTTTSPAGSKELVLGGDYIEGVVAIGTVTTSNTLSLANGTVQTATLTASTACTFTMPTAVAGKSFMLLLKQAATTGNGTATFTSVKWNGTGAPTITATAGKMDILSFVSDGTNWYGSITQGYTP